MGCRNVRAGWNRSAKAIFVMPSHSAAGSPKSKARLSRPVKEQEHVQGGAMGGGAAHHTGHSDKLEATGQPVQSIVGPKLCSVHERKSSRFLPADRKNLCEVLLQIVPLALAFYGPFLLEGWL